MNTNGNTDTTPLPAGATIIPTSVVAHIGTLQLMILDLQDRLAVANARVTELEQQGGV